MRKWLKLGTICLTCALFAGAGAVAINSIDKERHSSALAKSFNDIGAITNDADLVVRAHISKGFTLQESGSQMKVQNQIYNIVVQKVYKNESGLQIDDHEQLQLARMIGIMPPNESGFASIIDDSEQEIHPGEYLLFLHTVKDPHTEETYVVNNSPNHLYKWMGNNTLENVASSQLESFSEQDLVKALK